MSSRLAMTKNRVNILQARDKDNGRIVKKLQRQIRKMEG